LDDPANGVARKSTDGLYDGGISDADQYLLLTCADHSQVSEAANNCQPFDPDVDERFQQIFEVS